MPRVFATDIVEESTITGTGAYQLNGPLIGYRSFDEGYDNGDTPYYVVRNAGDTKYEHNRKGTFTVGAPSTLSRNVIYSSNGGAPVPWQASDHPLKVYVPAAIEMMEMLAAGWMADARSAYMTFGFWFDSSPAGSKIWKLYDGVRDITMGTINEADGAFESAFMPAGIGLPYFAPATTINPVPGFLRCCGEVVSQTTYSRLYAKLGTRYNTGGEGAGNFRLPDTRSTALLGLDGAPSDSGRFDAAVTNKAVLGGRNGAQTHTHTVSGSSSTTSFSGSTAGNHTVAVTSTSMDAESQGWNFADGPTYGAKTHTHANVVSSGSTAGNHTVSGTGSGSISGTAASATGIGPSMFVNYLISTGGQ